MALVTLYFHLVDLFSCVGYQVRDGSARGVAEGWVRRTGSAGRAVGVAIDQPPSPRHGSVSGRQSRSPPVLRRDSVTR